MAKQYISVERTLSPRPRSKRRRETGEGGGRVAILLSESAGEIYGLKKDLHNKYLTIDFFNKMFEVHGTKTYDVEVEDEETGGTVTETVTEEIILTPNEWPESTGEVTYAITGIKAKYGLWTEHYLSALGRGTGGSGGGSGGGGATALSGLVDVDILSEDEGGDVTVNAQDGQALVYDAASGKWKAGSVQSGDGHTHANKAVLDMITQAKVSSWDAVAAIMESPDQDAIVNKWLEVVNFLDTYTEADTLASLLGNKADKVSMTAGTYTKLTVNAQGIVTAGSTLAESDIPALPISKISGLQSALDGKLTQAQADGRYVKVDYFDSLFQLYLDDTKQNVNTDISSFTAAQKEKLNIKAMFGFWTEQYISALGRNGDSSGVAVTLGDLLDVDDSLSPASGQALIYDSTSGRWTNGNAGINETQLASYLTSHGYQTQNAADLRYLLLTGGTMTGAITRNAPSSWVKARDNAIIRSTVASADGYHPAFSIKTKNGDWSIGTLAYRDTLYATYATDENYTNNTNTVIQVAFPKTAGTLALLTDNVASATKLQTARNLWGNDFDGTANIGGRITFNKSTGDRQLYVDPIGSIVFKASTGGWAGGLYAYTNDGSASLGGFGFYGEADVLTRMFIGPSYNNAWVSVLSSGNVGIGTTSPVVKLDVSGNARVTDKLYLYKPNANNDTNAVYLKYENNGVHIVGGGLYADTYVSALGLGDDSGSVFDWSALTTYDNDPTHKIDLRYLDLSAYALKTDVPTLRNLTWSYGSVTAANGDSYNGSAAKSVVIPNTSHLTNDSGFITSSALGAYLPLSGGTMTGGINLQSALTSENVDTRSGHATGLVAKAGYPENSVNYIGFIGFMFGRKDDVGHDKAGIVLNADTTSNYYSQATGLYITADSILWKGTPLSLAGDSYTKAESDAKYLPLTAGSSKPLTGNLYLSSRSKSIYLPYTVNGNSVNIPLICDNGANIWIGSVQTNSTHHIGSTYISAGHNGTSGNETVYISVPNAANDNASNYGVLHYGNYTNYVYTKSQIDSQLTSLIANGTANRLAYYTAQRSLGYTGYISVMQNATNSKGAYLNGLRIWGACYGNDASTILSGTDGVMTYGDGGPQIIFADSDSNSGQCGTLLYTNNDDAGAGASFHFLSNQSDWNVHSKRFVARNSVTIGQNTPNTSYALYTGGNAYFSNRIYLAGGVYLEYNSQNGGVHLVGAGFYADEYVSALGLSDSGEAAFDEDAMWYALGGSPSNKQISSSHLTNALSGYALTSNISTITINGTSWNPYTDGNKTITISTNTLDNFFTSRPTSGNVMYGDGRMRQFKATSSMADADGRPEHDAHIIHLAWDNSGGWDAQIAVLTSGYGVKFRAQSGGTWGAWKQLAEASALGAYLPLSAGASYPLTESLYLSSVNKGVYITDPAGNNVPAFYQNGSNLWFGATQTAATHHRGATYISAGHDGSAGYGTIYVCVPNAANNGGTNYGVWHAGNLNPVTFIDAGTSALTSKSGSFFFSGATALQSGYDYVGFQAGGSDDKWQMVAIDGLKWRQNDTGGSDANNWTDWKTILDSSNYSTYAVTKDFKEATAGNTSTYTPDASDIGTADYCVITNYNANGRWQNMPTFPSSYYGGVLQLKGSSSALMSEFAWCALHGNATAPTGYLWWRARANKGYGSDWKRIVFAEGAGDIRMADIGNNTNSDSSKIDFRSLIGSNQYIYAPYIQAINVANYGRKRLSVFQKNNTDWTTAQVEVVSILPNGNVGVGNVSPGYKLDVDGDIHCNNLWIGGIKLQYDESNGGIYITNGGLSAYTYISALGVGADGEQGSGLDINAMWTELEGTSAHDISLRHVQSALASYLSTNGYVTASSLNSYATQSWVNNQGYITNAGVTSVAMSMPTGLKVNSKTSDTITSTGTFALTFADGYSIPTTTKQNSWDGKQDAISDLATIRSNASNGNTAYNWGNHAGLYLGASATAAAATKLATARSINGTAFDGSVNITTNSWGTARNICISDADSTNTGAAVSVNGSAAVTLKLPSTIKASLSGNATSATTASKLSTVSKTAWGKTYWTANGVPDSISGDLSSVGNISFSASGKNIGGLLYFDTATPQLRVATSLTETFSHTGSTITPKLFVNGEIGASGGLWAGFAELYYDTPYIDFHYNYGTSDYTTRIIENTSGVLSVLSPGTAGLVVGGYNGDYVQIGQIRIVYDYSNNALKIQHAEGGAANLYALGGISAIGMSSSSDGQVSASLVPSVSQAYDLGSSAYGWKKIYLAQSGEKGSIYVDGDGINLDSGSGGYLSGTVYKVTGRLAVGTGDDDYPDYSLGVYGNSYMEGRLFVNGTTTGSYTFYVNGTTNMNGTVYVKGSSVHTSDMRMKEVTGTREISLEEITRAPIVGFFWRDRDIDGLLHVGSSAQYWRSVLPETVLTDADGMHSLDYGVTALVSVISVARKVTAHEEEIKRLKAKISELETEVEQLKAA